MTEQQVAPEPVGGEPTGSAATQTPAAPAGTSESTSAQTPAAPAAASAAAPGADSIKAAEDQAAADEINKTKHLKLTQEQLNDRITQAKRAAAAIERARLKEIFGTDDLEQIKKVREEHSKFKADAEKLARERMTREQQLESDLQAARAEAQTLRDAMAAAEADRAYERQDEQVRSLARKHINEDLIEDTIYIFARNVVAKMSEEEAEQLDDARIEAWFAEFAKQKPAFGKTAPAAPAAPAPEPKPPTQVKKPITNGPKASEVKPPPNGTQEAAAKTPRPGQPNSMSGPEYAAFLRSKGLQY